MTNGSDRLERIERILEQVAKSQEQVAKVQQEMAARQQYHDEAIAADAENIRALVRASEVHPRRWENLEGGEATS